MRLPAKIRAALEATGKPWTIDEGKRHMKIRVDGAFVGILPKNGTAGEWRTERNLIAQIRRGANSRDECLANR